MLPLLKIYCMSHIRYFSPREEQNSKRFKNKKTISKIRINKSLWRLGKMSCLKGRNETDAVAPVSSV